MKTITAMLYQKWLWAFALLFFAGCAGEEAGPETRQVLIELSPETAQHTEFDDAGNVIPPDVTQNYSRILIAISGTEIDSYLGGNAELSVIVLNNEGEPIKNERVNFAILDEDPGDASLTAARTRTDDDGIAKMLFYVGTEERDFDIKVWVDERSIVFKVHALNMPTGTLDIGFEYSGPAELGSYELYVISNPLWCDDPYYLSAPQDILMQFTPESIYGRVLTEPILAGQRVAVVMRGRLASNGVIAAGGCVGDVRIDEKSSKRVTVTLLALNLNPAGTFEVANNFDFTGAIPGTLGKVIQELVLFFGDGQHERQIATALFDALAEVIRNFVSGVLAMAIEAVADWIDDYLNEIINNYIDHDAPAWVRKFFTVGSDVIRIVSNIEIDSTVRIAKPRSDGTFEGNQNWMGITLYWNLPCEGNPDPNCPRHSFRMDEIWDRMNEVQLVYGQFSGRIHSFNKGIIDSHVLNLQYGRLIIFVLNYIVFPWLTNSDTIHTVRDALLKLANCAAMARRITGDDEELTIGSWTIAQASTIEGWCNTVVGLVGDIATAIVNRLRIDTRLTLQGSMDFIEEDSDLTVDRLENGTWLGSIRTSNDEGPAFEGQFSTLDFAK